MKSTHFIASLLVWIGGINWGLFGLGSFFDSNWNVVNQLLGSWAAVEWIVYILVGVSAIYLVVTHKAHCRACEGSDAAPVM
ncbi:MAG: DUF378 domain-containing protein [bacterium]|nr:DUF378 domain-containing protein [bacterium]